MKRNSVLGFLVIVLFVSALVFNSGCKAKKEEAEVAEVTEIAGYKVVPDIKDRLAQFAPTEITYDESLLNDEQKQVLEKLVMAAKVIDKIFWKQASHVGLMMLEDFEKTDHPAAKDFLRYLTINFGPFDRLDEDKPFIGTDPKPLGAGFYPPNMTKDYFEGYVTGFPDMKKDLESTYTVVKKDDDSLISVPYNEAYGEDLEIVAKYLREAAEITTDEAFKAYLNQKAEDLLSNDYYKGDLLWIDLEGNLLEIVIGPYEVYEDKLMGIKASYESFVFINDFEEMAKLKGYLDYLGEMQRMLPVEQKYKDAKIEGLASPLNVVIEVFTAGDTKAGVQTLAFVLPNDERIREEKGTKKVFLKNMQEAKFNKVLVPISKKVLADEDAAHISFYAYFTETLLHEISHVFGVNYVTLEDGTKTTVNKALADKYSAIEECKATIVGMHNVPFLIEKGLIPKEKEREIYTTYLAGMFRSIRFGAHEAHGMGTLMQLNYHRETGVFKYNPETQKFSVDMDKLKDSITEMAQKILILEGNGNYDNAAAFIAKYGELDSVIQALLDSLTDIPVDIEPIFKF
ncbi:MAG: peptidase [Candidatus Aminicenantes bacterium]|nr:peptidase [Candidatus Aminicenantes bacterium]MDH5743613.1 peptidase [Candidatus Aminicenantes bacterium]